MFRSRLTLRFVGLIGVVVMVGMSLGWGKTYAQDDATTGFYEDDNWQVVLPTGWVVDDAETDDSQLSLYNSVDAVGAETIQSGQAGVVVLVYGKDDLASFSADMSQGPLGVLANFINIVASGSDLPILGTAEAVMIGNINAARATGADETTEIAVYVYALTPSHYAITFVTAAAGELASLEPLALVVVGSVRYSAATLNRQARSTLGTLRMSYAEDWGWAERAGVGGDAVELSIGESIVRAEAYVVASEAATTAFDEALNVTLGGLFGPDAVYGDVVERQVEDTPMQFTTVQGSAFEGGIFRFRTEDLAYVLVYRTPLGQAYLVEYAAARMATELRYAPARAEVPTPPSTSPTTTATPTADEAAVAVEDGTEEGDDVAVVDTEATTEVPSAIETEDPLAVDAELEGFEQAAEAQAEETDFTAVVVGVLLATLMIILVASLYLNRGTPAAPETTGNDTTDEE